MIRALGSLHWRLLSVANVLTATISGVLAVLLFIAPHWFGDTASTEYDLVLAAARDDALIKIGAIVGLLVVSGNLLWVVYGRTSRIPIDHVQSMTASGPVRVARDAIEGRLRAVGEALDEITRLRVTIGAVGPKRILIRASYQAPIGVSIDATSEKLRGVLDEQFRDLVNLVEGSRFSIDIEFASFAGKATKKDALTADPPKTEETFTGPKYPIDDETDHSARFGQGPEA